MNREEILELYKNDPEIFESSIEMSDANIPINIFEGEFIIKQDLKEIKINGAITFNWLPRSGAHFYGEILIGTKELHDIVNNLNSFSVIVDGLEFGQGFFCNIHYGDSNTPSYIKGTISGHAIMGDKSIPIEKIKFSMANLREFHGSVVKRITENNISSLSNRIIFENDEYIIALDKCYDYKERFKLLDEKGGYLILYSGALASKKGQITFENLKELFYCFDTFITLINGRRTSTLFIQGIYENQVIWTDYTDYFVDIHKTVQSWPTRHSTIGLNEMWNNFYTLWKNPEDKQFLVSAIHWYVESNGNTALSEGSIIMAQTALELLYNWWIVERKQLIIGKDSENITASNKIRLLLSQLNINYLVPTSFTQLQSFINTNKDIIDAPDAVVQIRNAIVHSQEEKRKKLSSIHYKAKFETLQLCVWYIEMSLLNILGFNGKYFNRCSSAKWAGQAEEYVPWYKKSNSK